jgi:hypothetical protein
VVSLRAARQGDRSPRYNFHRASFEHADFRGSKVKKVLITVGGALAGLALGGAALVTYLGTTEGSDLEAWLGQQVVAILDAYVVPEIAIAAVDYQAPYGVTLTDVTLRQGDDELLAVKELRLALAERPRSGRPLRIREIRLVEPRLQFIRSDAGFVGWSNLIEPQVRREGPAAVEEEKQLSEILVLELVEITDGEVRYVEPQHPDHNMVLPDINCQLVTHPVPEQPGWYRLDTTLTRAPVFDLDTQTRVNLDTSVAVVDVLSLELALAPEQYGTLPPRLQQLLQAHRVRGALTAQLSGDFDLQDPLQSSATLNAQLREAEVTMAPYRWSVDTADLQAELTDAVAGLRLGATLLGGGIDINGEATLRDAMPATAKWEVRDIVLEQALQAEQAAAPIAGHLRSAGRVTTELSHPQEALGGGGELHITEGRLMNLPVLKAILDLGLKLTGSVALKPQDSADATFEIKPDHIYFSDVRIKNPALNIKGSGQVFYDQRLDLTATARVMGNVEKLLGDAGKVLEALADNIAAYRITGTRQDPKLQVRPLGL